MRLGTANGSIVANKYASDQLHEVGPIETCVIKGSQNALSAGKLNRENNVGFEWHAFGGKPTVILPSGKRI